MLLPLDEMAAPSDASRSPGGDLFRLCSAVSLRSRYLVLIHPVMLLESSRFSLLRLSIPSLPVGSSGSPVMLYRFPALPTELELASAYELEP